MNVQRNRPLAALVSGTLLLAGALGGCEITEGADGLLSFRDTTVGDVSLSDKIGVGARVVIEVNCLGCANDTVSAASSSDEGVLEVVSTAGNLVTVRGVSAGDAELSVDVGGTVDRISLDVDNVADASVRLQPWPDIASLPNSLWADGFAMLPGSRIDVRAFARDTDGDRTTGFGAIEWQVDGGASLVLPEDRRSDTVRVTAPAAEGSFMITPSVGEAQPIAVVASSSVATMALYSAQDVVLAQDDTLTIESDGALILHLAAYTADGVYVAGDGGELATFTLSDGAEGLLEDTFATLADDPSDLDALHAAYARGFLLGATGQTGSGTMTFTWGEQTLSVTLEVVAPTEPAPDAS